MKVTIIGLGLIGGSIAIDLRAEGFAPKLPVSITMKST